MDVLESFRQGFIDGGALGIIIGVFFGFALPCPLCWVRKQAQKELGKLRK